MSIVISAATFHQAQMLIHMQITSNIKELTVKLTSDFDAPAAYYHTTK